MMTRITSINRKIMNNYLLHLTCSGFRKLKLWLLIMFLPLWVYSTHLVGGEMTYRYLGNDSFEVKMTVYRDCANGVPPFDDPAWIGLFDSNDSLLTTLSIYLSNQVDITNSVFNCLPVAPSNICYQKGEYIFNIFLPPIQGGYQFAYQRCCRPSGVVNIINPPLPGFTLYAKTLGGIWSTNSSPEFNLPPFSFICVNSPFAFDNSATDVDGDSLVYSLCTPFDGASNTNPAPFTPSSPPYSEINWLLPYSLADMIGGSSPLAIDSQSGLLSVTPDAEGFYTYGISVKEYRSGIYLGETRRDNTLYVINPIGINELEKDIVTISPNPFSVNTNIHISENITMCNARFEIVDAFGRIVKNFEKINSNDFIISAEQIHSGIYFYRFTNSGSGEFHGSLVIN